MQLFSAKATISLKKLPLKVAYFTAQSEIFSTVNRPKTSPNLIFCSIEMAHLGNGSKFTAIIIPEKNLKTY
jgi:hypothetical protein